MFDACGMRSGFGGNEDAALVWTQLQISTVGQELGEHVKGIEGSSGRTNDGQVIVYGNETNTTSAEGFLHCLVIRVDG